MQTIWRTIPSHPDYSASSDGEIKRTRPDKYGRPCRVLKQHQTKRGYRTISLSRDSIESTLMVHVAVCSAFHGPKPSESHQCAHGDGDRSNNKPSNLRWATAQENCDDRDHHGTTARGPAHWSVLKPERIVRGESNKGGGGKLTEQAVKSIRADTRYLKDIAADHDISISLASQIKRGKAWSHVL